MEQFKRASAGNSFNYAYERELEPNEEIILKMPSVSANKRGFNDIGWQTSGYVDLYGTLAVKPTNQNAIWQKIEPYDDVNHTISALKIVNGDEKCRIVIRALLN